MIEKNENKEQIITIINASRLEMNLVCSILSMDDEQVILETDGGVVSINGSELKVHELSERSTKIAVSGTLGSISFDDKRQKKRGWFS